MVAVLDNQVIRITIVASRVALHELPYLDGVQACSPNKYGLPEFETRALPRFDLKDTTRRIVVSSKCIFYTVNYQV